MPHEIEIRNALIAQLVEALAYEHYSRVYELAANSRINESALRTAVKDYGRRLLPLPKEEWHRIDYVEVSNSHPRAWSVVVPLFTVEEGLSDLSLLLTVVNCGPNKFELEIDDIHVL